MKVLFFSNHFLSEFPTNPYKIPTMITSVYDWLYSTYAELSIDPSTIVDKLSNPSSRYTPILREIVANPDKYRYITDTIVGNPVIRESLPVECRSMLSNAYPTDKKLALQLLIGTTSYYRFYDFENPEDEDEDSLPVGWHLVLCHYRNVVHCPDYYFMHHFYPAMHSNALVAILKENDVDPYKFDELWAFYKTYTNSHDITE